MSEHIMENLTIRPLNDILEKLSKRANEHEIRNGTLSALTERCNRLEAENAKLRELVRDMHGELVSCEDNGYVCGGHKFDKRVRETGIEVIEE